MGHRNESTISLAILVELLSSIGFGGVFRVNQSILITDEYIFRGDCKYEFHLDRVFVDFARVGTK